MDETYNDDQNDKKVHFVKPEEPDLVQNAVGGRDIFAVLEQNLIAETLREPKYD